MRCCQSNEHESLLISIIQSFIRSLLSRRRFCIKSKRKRLKFKFCFFTRGEIENYTYPESRMPLMSLGGVECCEIHVQSERDNQQKRSTTEWQNVHWVNNVERRTLNAWTNPTRLPDDAHACCKRWKLDSLPSFFSLSTRSNYFQYMSRQCPGSASVSRVDPGEGYNN